MVSSLKLKQRQFGLKLLLIAIIIGITFSIWYFTEKQAKSDENVVKTTSNQAR